MAIEAIMLDLFRSVRSNLAGRRLRVLSAGYPDLLVDEATIERLFGADIRARLTFRADSEKIARWHGLEGRLARIIEADHFFNLLDCDLDVIDVACIRGNEIIADLNFPLDTDTLGEYDVVLDSGTCEHVFNAGQAIINLAGLVRQGGFLVQAAPLNSFNHGFYNFNPTLFHDFYSAENGYRLVFIKGVSNIVAAPKTFDVPPFSRFGKIPENSILLAVAERVSKQALKPVVQHKYKGMIG